MEFVEIDEKIDEVTCVILGVLDQFQEEIGDEEVVRAFSLKALDNAIFETIREAKNPLPHKKATSQKPNSPNSDQRILQPAGLTKRRRPPAANHREPTADGPAGKT